MRATDRSAAVLASALAWQGITVERLACRVGCQSRYAWAVVAGAAVATPRLSRAFADALQLDPDERTIVVGLADAVHEAQTGQRWTA